MNPLLFRGKNIADTSYDKRLQQRIYTIDKKENHIFKYKKYFKGKKLEMAVGVQKSIVLRMAKKGIKFFKFNIFAKGHKFFSIYVPTSELLKGVEIKFSEEDGIQLLVDAMAFERRSLS